MKFFKILILILLMSISSIGMAACTEEVKEVNGYCILPQEFIAASKENRESMLEDINNGNAHLAKVKEYCNQRHGCEVHYTVDCCNEYYLISKATYTELLNLFLSECNVDEVSTLITILEGLNYEANVLTVGKIDSTTNSSSKLTGEYSSFFKSEGSIQYISNTSTIPAQYYAILDFRINGKNVLINISNTDYERLHKHFAMYDEPISFKIYIN